MKLAGVAQYGVLDASAAALARVADELEAESVPYSLSYGTALGAARHGGFVPHDYDIDLLIPNQYAGIVRRLAPRIGGVRMYTEPPWSDQHWVNKLIIAGAFNIDVFTEGVILNQRHREALAPFFRSERPALETIMFCGRPFSIIPNYREHLDYEYGPDWPVRVRYPDGNVSLDEYLRVNASFHQPDLRGIKRGHCVVPGVFDGPRRHVISGFARARLLFGRVTAAVESDVLAEQRGYHPQFHWQDRLRMIGSLRWVDDVVYVESYEFAPSSPGPGERNADAVERFMMATGADLVACPVDARYRHDLDDVTNRYSHLRSTGRLRIVDTSGLR